MNVESAGISDIRCGYVAHIAGSSSPTGFSWRDMASPGTSSPSIIVIVQYRLLGYLGTRLDRRVAKDHPTRVRSQRLVSDRGHVLIWS